MSKMLKRGTVKNKYVWPFQLLNINKQQLLCKKEKEKISTLAYSLCRVKKKSQLLRYSLCRICLLISNNQQFVGFLI